MYGEGGYEEGDYDDGDYYEGEEDGDYNENGYDDDDELSRTKKTAGGGSTFAMGATVRIKKKTQSIL
jgi:hypothetical protein